MGIDNWGIITWFLGSYIKSYVWNSNFSNNKVKSPKD